MSSKWSCCGALSLRPRPAQLPDAERLCTTGWRHRDAGFTALEALVTLIIIALATAGIGAVFRPNIQRNALDLALATLRSVAATAHTEALRSGQIITLTFDLRHNALILSEPRQSRELERGVSVEIVSAREISVEGKPAIAFFPDGSSSGGEITLRAGELAMHTKVKWHNGRLDAGS